MGSMLEFIARESDPAHDFDDIRFYNQMTGSIGERLVNQAKNLGLLFTMGKPALRGSMIGGTVGAISSLAGGGSPAEGMAKGAQIGAMIDLEQYFFRGVYRYLRTQICPSKDESSRRATQ